MTKKGLLLCLPLLLLGGAEIKALQADEIAACGTFGSCSFAIVGSGDVYASTIGGSPDYPPGPWGPVGNIFVSAGGGSGGLIAGITFNNCLGPSYVVAQNGDFFVLTNVCGGVGAYQEGNIFGQAGRPASVIVTVGRSECGRFAYSAASNGDVFRKDGTGQRQSGWEFAGNIPTGAVPVKRESIGSLKVRYR